MYDIAEQVADWVGAGREVTVAVAVATRGFSSREPAAAGAWSGSDAVGALAGWLPGGAPSHGLVEVEIGDEDAVRAGLACGGVATLLVRSADAYPEQSWGRLAAGEPLCLVTELAPGGAPGATRLFTPHTIRDAARSGSYGDPIPRLFGRGTTAAALIDTEGGQVAAVALWPVPSLLVVGDGLIAAALADQAALLGWSSTLAPELDAALAAIAGLRGSDAVVVLSHDRAVDGPVLAAALASGAGYVGGLGARHTQAARREWLTAHGVDEPEQARIHGPAGLDVDAHTPAEIAVSIAAEILAHRSGSPGGSLSARSGPVHTAGVNAPPPRY